MSNHQEFANIYNEFRTLVLNTKYYAIRTTKCRQWLRRMDIFMALFAGGSALLGLDFWKTNILSIPVGKNALIVFTAIAVILGILRPILKLEDELEKLSGIHAGYSSLAYAMNDLVTRVMTNKVVDAESTLVYTTVRTMHSSIAGREGTDTDQKLSDEQQKLVDAQYPADTYFYYPPVVAAGATPTPTPPSTPVTVPISTSATA